MSKKKPLPPHMPTAEFLSTHGTSRNHEAAVAQLKAALLARAERIEQLEMTKRRLEDQPSAMSRRTAGAEAGPVGSTTAELAVPAQEIARVPPSPIPPMRQAQTIPPKTLVAPDPAGRHAKLPIERDFVRTVTPALGIYSDHLTERYFEAHLVAERALVGCARELWFMSDGDEILAHVHVKINGKELHATQLLNIIKFPMEIAANAIFQLAVECDYVKPVVPPDKQVDPASSAL